MSRSYRRLALLTIAAVCLAFGPAVHPSTSRSSAAAPSRQRAALRLADAWRRDVQQALARDQGMQASGRSDRTVALPTAPLTAGDLVTASTFKSQLLALTLKGANTRVTATPLQHDFVPRGVDVSRSGLVAIAAVSQVLLYDPLVGELRVFTRPEGKRSKFGFAADVLFDEQGQLIIADMGAVAIGKAPTDGRIWQLNPSTGEIVRLAASRPLSNPKLLALDSKGRVLLVDGEGGLPISQLVEGHYDFIYRLKGKKRAGAKPIFREPGLQATAFDVDAADRAWFGMGGEVGTIDGQSMTLPCRIPAPFTFVTGIVATETGTAQLLDGVDQLTDSVEEPPGARTIWDADATCSVTRRVHGSRIDQTRGLARYDPEAD